ncbi:PepSY domain-containing protein [Rhodovulum marinum]|uniref:Putative membrane protein YkoI n=1 Tax=Rhodovulum marinum TaxID=320662 RepID=A0A4R2Q878_9RHOB|nr:PepSY domain-containing protein [Rhodovulum marinum]TCP44178.1 putative membrane protein YkoI [Rhodovulum marinum]
MTPRLPLAPAVLALLLGLAVPAGADRDDDRDHDRARDALARGEILPLHTILPGLQDRFGGRLLEVELEREDGRMVYEVELITARGRILEIVVDAATGRVLETEEDD